MDQREWEARLREIVALEVGRSSLRQVAREIGMSPTGITKFLAGTSAYRSTLRKLDRLAAAQLARVDSYPWAPPWPRSSRRTAWRSGRSRA